jgi:N-acetyl sugar amidotransferase
MDTSDPHITFNEREECNHCTAMRETLTKAPFRLTKKEREKALRKEISIIKKAGKKSKYDCLIGVSGGVDSSYVAHLVKQLGLRPLAVHLDNGWNSELAISNIEKILTKLHIPLITKVLDWEEFKQLQLSFLKASVPDLEVPTDHAINALLYSVAAKHNIKYIINGANINTEGIHVGYWSRGNYDWRYIRKLQKKFGTKKLKDFPHITPAKLFYYTFIRRMQRFRILDYVEYNKKDVVHVLEKEYEWKKYITKHGESTYTHLIQSHILPVKFGYDKRKMHLSSLICSGQITREQALQELEKPLFTQKELEELIEYSSEKLGIAKKEFEQLMKLPNKSFEDYPSYDKQPLFRFLKNTYKKMRAY